MRLIFLIISILLSGYSFADKSIISPNGNAVVFSESISGENIDKDSWRKIIFLKNNIPVDISPDGRYFTKANGGRYYTYSDQNVLSPSGKYLLIYSVEGGILSTGDGDDKYVDRAYCGIVNMDTGCMIDGKTGMECSDKWDIKEDVLVSSDGEKDDLLPINIMLDDKDINPNYKKSDLVNFTLCDAPKIDNIHRYYLLSALYKKQSEQGKFLNKTLLDWVNQLNIKSNIKDKTYLYSEPDENKMTKMYLVAGDLVKVIKESENNEWVYVAYITNKQTPLLYWVKKTNLSL
jgi:hypothetical protein